MRWGDDRFLVDQHLFGEEFKIRADLPGMKKLRYCANHTIRLHDAAASQHKQAPQTSEPYLRATAPNFLDGLTRFLITATNFRSILFNLARMIWRSKKQRRHACASVQTETVHPGPTTPDFVLRTIDLLEPPDVTIKA
jgi:hypothetical protein